MIAYLATYVALPFTVSMVSAHIVGCLANGVPLTPWFVRDWHNRRTARIETRRAETLAAPFMRAGKAAEPLHGPVSITTLYEE